MSLKKSETASVLYVEDDPSWIETHRQHARQHGIDGIFVSDVPSALKAFARRSYTAAIIDKGAQGDSKRTNLPGNLSRRGGLQIAYLLRELQAGCEIVLNTGESWYGQEVIDSGAHAFVWKGHWSAVEGWILTSITSQEMIVRNGHPKELQIVKKLPGMKEYKTKTLSFGFLIFTHFNLFSRTNKNFELIFSASQE